MSDDTKTTEAQREAQSAYNQRMKEKGYFQTRPWLPVELKDWHALLVRRTRDWKELGGELDIPPLPKDLKKHL